MFSHSEHGDIDFPNKYISQVYVMYEYFQDRYRRKNSLIYRHQQLLETVPVDLDEEDNFLPDGVMSREDVLLQASSRLRHGAGGVASQR